MEVEDALSVKFRTLIEGLMVATTSEIVRMFSKLLTETRVEISRSWKEIDLLKQQLEECELQKTEAIFRAQMLSELKSEDDEVEVSRMVSHPVAQNTKAVRPQPGGSEKRAEITSVEDRDIGVENDSDRPETDQSSNTGAPISNIRKVAENSPPHNQETHSTQTVVEPILLCPANESPVKGESTSSDKTQLTSNTVSNGPSLSTGMLTVNSMSKEIKPVMKKRKLIKKKKHASDMINSARALRDRQHLNMHRRCMCCTTEECYIQSMPSRAHHQVPTVYVCRKCEKRFKTHMLFKNHKCSMPQSCERCGQMFATMQGFSAHSREVSPMSRPQFRCSQCHQTFTTQCAWNLHKKIHTNSTSAQDTSENIVDSLDSHTVDVHKDIKTKLEVRLERISDSQLEAALCTQQASLQDSPTKCASSKHTRNPADADPADADPDVKSADETSKAKESNQTLSDSRAELSDVRKVYAVMSSSTCQPEISEDTVSLQSPTAHGSDKVKDRGKWNSERDESRLSSSPRKRKMADCSHDAFNGVFPVEKILKWRDNKGKNEVRVKWMPCSLCGAKFQNTWEPAESFPDLLETNE